jgi:hypothetical protein
MTVQTEQIFEEALGLPANEEALLAEPMNLKIESMHTNEER